MESTIEKLKDLINNFDPVSYLPDIASIMSWASLFARICILVAPAVMLLCGLRYLIFPPREANHEAGYRFYFGMGSVEAWRFTQLLAGIVWTLIGLGLSIAMYLIGKDFPNMELGPMVDKSVICIFWQIVLILLSYFSINLTLIIRYNRHGDVRWKK